ncbi:HAMP domain-containing histidine kinase [Nostoc linckia FACHB-104]|nr:HAMP domain-containing histidine kinase [Nostoc linckia FACHB-104]
MVARFPIQEQETGSTSQRASSIESYCELYAQQLTSHYHSCCVRIVYHHCTSKKHQEVVKYAENQLPFSRRNLAYLNSEQWLKSFPRVFDVEEFKLAEFPKYFSYVCPIGYKNQKPEYIQLINNQPIAANLQESLKKSAIILNKYLEIYSESLEHKSEIQLLEHILHKFVHQQRNSLALISLYAHSLYLGLEDISWQQQALAICESIQELDDNINAILSCSQGSKLNIAVQDVRQLILESINFFLPISQQKKLKFHIPDTSITICLDKFQIKQVFDNLISNAIHFSPDLGTITFSWQIFKEEVLIQITDQGLGILPEEIQEIFNPFYSRRPGGTGLGLTIAKKIVLDHHGSLWAQNIPEGGARFSIILPRK